MTTKQVNSGAQGSASGPIVTAADRAFFRRLGELERTVPKPLPRIPRTLAQVAAEIEAIEKAWPWAKPLPDNPEKDLAAHRALREKLLRLSHGEGHTA